MKIKDIINYLEEVAPSSLQASYDNCGLLVGSEDDEITAALITLDCTEDVVEEAKRKGAGIIIAHHPIIFSGLRSLTGKNYIERTVIKAIQEGIAIYAIHTNLDSVLHGVNAKIAEKLGLQKLRILQPSKDNSEVGAGMVGELPETMKELDFLGLLKENMELSSIRYTSLLNRPVQKVAFCGGSGSFLLEDAKAAGAEVFISSDFKYHQFFDAENEIVIADIGHYEAEKYTKELIYEILHKKFATFTLHFSEVNTNPVNYL